MPRVWEPGKRKTSCMFNHARPITPRCWQGSFQWPGPHVFRDTGSERVCTSSEHQGSLRPPLVSSPGEARLPPTSYSGCPRIRLVGAQVSGRTLRLGEQYDIRRF